MPRKARKPIRDTLWAMDQVAQLLKAAGFEHRETSLTTESCYYGWPGMPHLLRVSTHSQCWPGKGQSLAKPVMARITLTGTHLVRRGTLAIADEKLYHLVASAIGQYFLRAAGLGWQTWQEELCAVQQVHPGRRQLQLEIGLAEGNGAVR